MPQLAVADDVEIFYSDHGRGPAVLMLHGLACDGSDWVWLASDLVADHRVVVIDLRGHGRSTPTAGPYGAKIMADDAAKVLRHLSVESAVVVGHSLGTLVASALAVEHPDMVAALVLADPGYGYTDETVAPMIAALRRQPLEAALEIFARMYVDTSPPWQRFWHERRVHGTPTDVIVEAFCACYEGVDGIGHRTVGETYLGRRKCPILSVHSAANAALVAAWEESLPHGRYDEIVVWNDCGHFLHQELPEKFAGLTRAWLDGLPRQR
jgi:pimeloyl-ACP methyl ester carboxylesterase